MRYIAYTTKGLEEVTKLELQVKLEGIVFEEISDKRIIFTTDKPIEQLVELKTVDDLGILINQVNDLNSLDQLVDLLSVEKLKEVQRFIKNFREIRDKSFSITVSIAKSNLKSAEVTSLVQKCLKENLKWEYIELDHTNFDIRVFVDDRKTYISVRLTQESLHNRAYKTNSKQGSLKPTVAGAMVILATNFQKDLKVVDNFSGSGTILCESYLLGSQVYGGDIDPESTEITKKNLINLGYNTEDKIRPLDARKTCWPENYFDCAISNLPWDKQIEVTSITDLYENSVKEYFRILKPTGKLCAIVSKPELFIKFIKKFRPEANIKELKIGLLGQNPTIVLAK